MTSKSQRAKPQPDFVSSRLGPEAVSRETKREQVAELSFVAAQAKALDQEAS